MMSVKEVFVDTMKFATDRDLKNSLSILILLKEFQKKINDDIDLLDIFYMLYVLRRHF